MSDIDGVNPSRTTRQQHLGEAARRGANIERDMVPDLDREMIERVGELDPATRDPGMIALLERERHVGAELVAGLVDAPLSAADQAGQDQCLRLCPALRQALLDEELIGPPLCRHLSRNQARAGCAAISRPSADSAIATMWRALRPAWSYCACGESWSRNTSVNTIVRIFSP